MHRFAPLRNASNDRAVTCTLLCRATQQAVRAQAASFARTVTAGLGPIVLVPSSGHPNVEQPSRTKAGPTPDSGCDHCHIRMGAVWSVIMQMCPSRGAGELLTTGGNRELNTRYAEGRGGHKSCITNAGWVGRKLK